MLRPSLDPAGALRDARGLIVPCALLMRDIEVNVDLDCGSGYSGRPPDSPALWAFSGALPSSVGANIASVFNVRLGALAAIAAAAMASLTLLSAPLCRSVRPWPLAGLLWLFSGTCSGRRYRASRSIRRR